MTFSDSASGDEERPSLGVEAFGEVSLAPIQQRVDGPLPMVPCDVGAQLEPDALDAAAGHLHASRDESTIPRCRPRTGTLGASFPSADSLRSRRCEPSQPTGATKTGGSGWAAADAEAPGWQRWASRLGWDSLRALRTLRRGGVGRPAHWHRTA